MSSTISLSKSLRTNKVASDPGSTAETYRIFTAANNQCDIPTYLVDTYGRPTSIEAGLQFEGYGAPGCISPQYRIQVENNLRPQYGEYLNVPAGLVMTQNEYANRPHSDLMGMNRDRAFGLDGVYRTAPFPTQKNPNSDRDYLRMEEWNANRLLTKFDNRLWLNSADTQSGF